MTAIAITEPGIFISARVASALRHGLVRDLEAARFAQRPVDPEIADAVRLIDLVGGQYANKSVSSVSRNVSTMNAAEGHPPNLVSVSTAAAILEVTPQNVTALLRRGSLLGIQGPGGVWAVSLSAVNDRKAASQATSTSTDRSNS